MAKGARNKCRLDPRAELLLLLLANVVAFTQRSLKLEIAWVAFLLFLIVICGCGKSAVKLGAAFCLCLILQRWLLPNGPKFLASSFSIIVSYARKIFPCLIVGTLVVKKTSVRELTAALRSWHVPQSLIISLSVTLRYFPAIKEEIGYIQDAMKLRNIRGIQKLEGILVPVMISATATAEELSAAAVTRGIENPKPKTSMVRMHMRLWDFGCLGVGIFFCILAVLIR